LEASRWMCRCLFNIVQYFILQLLCRVTGIIVGVHVSDAYGGVELTVALSSLTSELDGDEWLASCCDRPVPGKGSRYPLNRRLLRLLSLSGRFGVEENISPLLGFEPRIVRTVPSLV
jgi:hypothetical protein